MKAVWLSSTYYMDPKLAGCNAAVERMFTRLLAYAGNAETRGFLPANVHNLVGIPSGFRAISELVSRGILEPVEGGGYYFKAWANWNESGDKLLERREKDRERQRKARSKSAPLSRDKSRDVTPPEESRGEENSDSHVPTAAYVSNASELEIAPAATDFDQPGRKIDVDGWKLIRHTCGHLTQATKAALAHEAGAMLKQGVPADDVTAGLERWMSKDLGPGQLPHLVSDVIRARTRPANALGAQRDRIGLSAHDRKTLAWDDAAAEVKRSLGLLPSAQTSLPSTDNRPLLGVIDGDYTEQTA